MKRTFHFRFVVILVILFWGLQGTIYSVSSAPNVQTFSPPLVGFTIHFDFLESKEDAEKLLNFAYTNKTEILNVVPSPHIWKNKVALEILKTIFSFATGHRMKIILTRIDGSEITGDRMTRDNYIYSHILTQRGKLPSGKDTPFFFCNPVGNLAFIQWQKEETEYYARHFSNEPTLMGFSVGMFNEPFVSQRGSLLCFDETTNSYEIAQYTPYGLEWWHKWLNKEFHGRIKKLNGRYSSSFKDFNEVPMPVNEKDDRFGNSSETYWDLVRALNSWVVSRYEECRKIWHTYSKKNIPFILQFSGYMPEKLVKGRPAFAALDVFDWISRADALGLSLYTNAEYDDKGHASDKAMVHFLQLAHMMNKKIFILESGYEDNGAVCDNEELDFFVSQASELHPESVIYEFLKMSYDETFPNNSGKIIDQSWNIRKETVEKLIGAFDRIKTGSVSNSAPIYIYDDPNGLKNSENELNIRKMMINMAYDKPIVFIPQNAIQFLPRGSMLNIPKSSLSKSLLRMLKSRGISFKVGYNN